jgi:hypothetical protein
MIVMAENLSIMQMPYNIFIGLMLMGPAVKIL